MIGDVEHEVPHRLPHGRGFGAVKRLGDVQPCAGKMFGCPQPVELEPDVFPRMLLRGAVGIDLSGADQKALIFLQIIAVGYTVFGGGIQNALSGDDIVKQKVVADKGAERMQGCTLLPTVLVEPKVQEILVGKE